MQNSEYTKNLSIPIPQNILIGKLIGREGRNIKPIAERTGTHIHVNTNKIPAQIKIYVNNKKEIPPFENRINDASSQLNDLINKISQQENKKVDKINKKKEISSFENRINDVSNQLNDSTKQISKQGNKKIDKNKKEKKKKDKKVLKKVESERPSKEVQHNSQELKKTLTKIVVNNKVTKVAVVNDDLPEKFSRFSKNFKRKCENKPKNYKQIPDGKCWYGVDCRRKFCQFEHPSVRQYYNRHLILRYKKEIYSRKCKRDFKKESRLFIKDYKIEN